MAVIEGRDKIIANQIFSQEKLHEKYGGVVPEIASRNHLKKISPLLEEALAEAEVGMGEVDLVVSTYGPGLVGPLLVGLSLGKSLAYSLEVPFLGVNHLEGHIFAHLSGEETSFPFLALLVSGGHTSLILVEDWGDYRKLGGTRDDAAGEAFDKVGYMTGLGYPAGPKIDRLSREGSPEAVDFPRPMIEKGYDFSFAGLKTAFKLQFESEEEQRLPDLLASFQEAVVDTLVTKAIRAAKEQNCSTISAMGGVSANSRLRERLLAQAKKEGLEANFPPLELCTDNAAMIGLCGAFRHREFGDTSPLSLGPDPSLKLG